MTAHLTILGGGSIGCFLGFALAGPTLHVTVLSRPPIAALAAAGSMAVFKLDGERLSRSPNLQLVDSMDALPERTDGVLVTTKVHDLAAVVSAWMARAPTLDVPIWGLQNGLRSHAVLAEIGVRDPRAGSVTFNVVRSRERWTQTTSGALLLPAHPGCRVTGSIH
ncbi:MAG: 2-dehydropantoate 2-reductase N-terminal domain-containing protein, partial [Nannocystaceae bacterium]